MSLEHFIIAALATYRLTRLIHKEDGPFDIAARFRTWAGIKFDEYSNPYSTGQLSAAINCPYCLSVWIGIGVTILLGIAALLNVETIALYLLLPFALSGLATYFFMSTGV